MKELKIQIPDNQEIDWEASAKEKQIVLKDKQLTYEDVCRELFAKCCWYSDINGNINLSRTPPTTKTDLNNAPTKRQLVCIYAKNKLANVAVYLNNEWKPNLEKDSGYCIILDHYNDLMIDCCAVLCSYSLGKIMFKSKELARQAIKILGEDVVRMALEPLY